MHLLDREAPDVAVLAETELDKLDDSLKIPGYKIYSALPTAKGRIRVLLLLRLSLALSAPPSLLAVSHQEIWIRLPCASGSWTVAAVYRQWGNDEAHDLDALCDNARTFSSSSPRVVIAGDLNLDVSRAADRSYYRRALLLRFLDTMGEIGFRLENDNTPTYRSHGAFGVEGLHRASVLDLVLTLGLIQRPTVRVLADTVTDHYPVLSLLPMQKSPARVKVLRFRDLKRVSKLALLMHINAAALSEVYCEEDVDDITGIIVSEVTAVLDTLAPQKTVLIKDSPTPPLSLTRETRALMEARDTAACQRDWPLFRRLRNQTAHQVRRDRLASNRALLDKCQGDSRRLWQLADSLTGRGTTEGPPPRLECDGQLVEGDDKMAGIMNGFFIDKVERIRANIEAERLLHQQQQRRGREERSPSLSSSSSLPSSSLSSTPFKLLPPSEGDVLAAIRGLRNTPALGEDGIPTRILKDLAPVLAGPLAHLMRRSFATARVPSVFKIANVVPILKKGKDANKPGSYRPVALLPALSKILESLVLRQLTPHLAARLPPEQWGFRRNRSTAAALATAQGHWARLRAAGQVIAIAAFDYSAAFDTVAEEELVVKLEKLEIGDRATLWIRDYLRGRRQRVRLGAASSSLQAISYGVPQGSLLGPTLFIALTHDLPDYLDLDKSSEGVTVYADDTCLWVSHKSTAVIKSRLEELAKKLSAYSLSNSLCLNADKTQIMWIGASSPPTTTVGAAAVPPAEVLLLLGISFDCKLSLAPHLQSLLSSAGSLLALARRLLVHLPRGPQVRGVVRSLVKGKLCYGALLLPHRLAEDEPVCQLMQAVQVRINNIARLLLGVSRTDKIPVQDLLARSGLPSLNRDSIATTIVEMWKALGSSDGADNGRNPLGIILSGPPPPPDQSARLTRSTAAGDLPPPLLKKDQVFVWNAVKIYNTFPPLRSARSLSAVQKLAASFSSAAPV